MSEGDDVADGSGGEEGSSFETAVEIEASNYWQGMALELRWLEAHYLGYRKRGQMLTSHGGRVYDVITIVTAAGEEKVYFDMTAFWGKF